MKSSILLLLLGAILLAIPYNASTQSASTNSNDSTITLNVSGVCEMCKERIEEAAKGKGIKTAIWDVSTKLLTLTYNPQRVSPQKVVDRIVDVGYDAGNKKADDKKYNSLPDCCRYREFSSMDEMHSKNETIKQDVDSSSLEVVSHVDSLNDTHPGEANVVKGIVLEQNQKGEIKPLIGASVIWVGSSKGTASGTDGSFKIMPVNGEKRLAVSYVGYKSDTVIVNDTIDLRIILTARNQLQEVRVTSGSRASTYVNRYDPVRTMMITQKELLKAACCNLSESFETNPSVDVSFNDAVTGSKQIQLLGLSGNYTQLTVENLPGPRGLATPLGLNSIPGTWVESIQLIKGTGSVINGYESIAGQINVELKKPQNSESLYANVYVNDFGKTDLNLNLSQKISKKWSTALLLHDAFGSKKMDFNKDGFRDIPTGNLFSGINRWTFDNGKGLMAQFGVKLLDDRKTGGEVEFDPSSDKLTTNHYGLEIDIKRQEAFAKLGYVFPQKEHRSIGLQVSSFRHDQDSYFGLTTYKGQQKNFYTNLIYQSIINNTKHKFKTGFSFQLDQYNEDFNAANFRRKEVVPGAFFEYAYSPSHKFDVVAGIRGDHNSLFGAFATPRLNLRYEPVKGTTVRLSAGRGQRTANIFAENNSVFVSSRAVSVIAASDGKAYGLNPEVSWNKGISIDQKFRLFNRTSTMSVDFFRNDFANQIVTDLENPRIVSFYNLDGKSYSNSLQTELAFEPLKKLNLRLAYRFFDVKTTYINGLLQKPLTSRHRAFANLGYEVKGWKFDYTLSYNSKKRLPSTEANPDGYKLGNFSKDYAVMNAQVSKTIGKKFPVDIYLGGENLSNFLQNNAILSSEEPFSNYFDASLIWGPVTGRMIYAGARFTIKQ